MRHGFAMDQTSEQTRIACNLAAVPAASAMLGQSLVRLKLGVFSLSSGIAGLGGLFMASAMGSVSNESFSIMVSLSLLMLTVVAGIGYVSGALFGGLMAGVGFAVIMGSFANLAAAQPELSGMWTFLGHVAAVSPTLIGIGVAANPSGSVLQVVEGYRSLAGARPVLAGGAAVVAVSYMLALTGVLDNWCSRRTSPIWGSTPGVRHPAARAGSSASC